MKRGPVEEGRDHLRPAGKQNHSQLNRGVSRGDGVHRGPKGRAVAQPAPLSPSEVCADGQRGPDVGRQSGQNAAQSTEMLGSLLLLPPSAPSQQGQGRELGEPPKAPLWARGRGSARRDPGAGAPRGGDSRQHPRVSPEDPGLLRRRHWWSWLIVTPQFALHARVGTHRMHTRA